ncbi:unnamed protein product [Absidia cylindrospora]
MDHSMSHFEQPSVPLAADKLPSISVLPSLAEHEPTVPFSEQRPHHHDMYQQQQQQQQHQQNVVSPPLTPAVSPSSVLMNNLKYQRKYSVDVGPFGFGSGNVMLPHHISQEEYRRGSTCSTDLSPNHHQNHHRQQYQRQHHPLHQSHLGNNNAQNNDYNFLNDAPMDPFSMVGAENDDHHSIMQKTNINSDGITTPGSQLKPRRPSRFISQPGPNTQHKHVCKYSFCGWSFKRYEHLKRHMMVHTGERPHLCPFQGCGKSFSRSDNFHAHYRTHTKKAMSQQNRRLSSSSPSPTNKAPKKQQKKQQLHEQQHQQTEDNHHQQHQQPMFMSDFDPTRISMNPYEMYDQRSPIYSNQDHRQYMRPYDINPVPSYPISSIHTTTTKEESNHTDTTNSTIATTTPATTTSMMINDPTLTNTHQNASFDTAPSQGHISYNHPSYAAAASVSPFTSATASVMSSSPSPTSFPHHPMPLSSTANHQVQRSGSISSSSNSSGHHHPCRHHHLQISSFNTITIKVQSKAILVQSINAKESLNDWST